MNFRILIVFILWSLKLCAQEHDLSFYLEKARTNSPLLLDLSNQIKSNQLDSLINVASYKTQISASLNTAYYPIIRNIGYDNTLSNDQLLSGLVNVNQKIANKYIVRTQNEAFKLLREGIILNKEITLKDINRAITSQYIMASGSEEQIVYQNKITNLLQEEALILRNLARSSIYKQTDYLIFLSSLKQQELQLLMLKQQHQNDLGILNYLSGQIDVSNVGLKKTTIALNSTQNENEIVFFKKFKTDSLKIINQNQIIRNGYKPTLLVFSDVGYLSSLTSQSSRNFGIGFGFGLTIPIYDGHQKVLELQKNNLLLSSQTAYKTSYKNQYEQQLALLHQQLDQINQTENQLDEQLQIADVLVEADKKLLLTGDTQITDFVIAIGNVISINNNRSQNKIKKLQVINDINYWSSKN